MADRAATPYPNDIAYVTHELDYAKARARRIGLLRRIRCEEDEAAPLRGVIGAARTPNLGEYRRVLALAEQEETGLRGEIDERLKVNRKVGPSLGVDELCATFGLGQFERTALILASIGPLGESVAAVIDPISHRGYSGGFLIVDSIWDYLDMNIGDRIRSRMALLPTAPLLKGGLITLDVGKRASPAAIAEARVEITAAAFSKIVGVPELALDDGGEA